MLLQNKIWFDLITWRCCVIDRTFKQTWKRTHWRSWRVTRSCRVESVRATIGRPSAPTKTPSPHHRRTPTVKRQRRERGVQRQVPPLPRGSGSTCLRTWGMAGTGAGRRWWETGEVLYTCVSPWLWVLLLFWPDVVIGCQCYLLMAPWIDLSHSSCFMKSWNWG